MSDQTDVTQTKKRRPVVEQTDHLQAFLARRGGPQWQKEVAKWNRFQRQEYDRWLRQHGHSFV